jgi:AcrR family transcriptional regulator
VSNNRWYRHGDEELATDELLDAAGRAFAELGVAKATMVDVARAAGCSRATLYRYFPNQEALHLGFVHRATLRIAAELASDRDAGAPDSLADRILSGIDKVRADPLLAVWFEPENMAVPMSVSQNSELLNAMAVGVLGSAEATPEEHKALERRAAWLLRSIVSILAAPGTDREEERAMVESFIVPVLTAAPDSGTSVSTRSSS